jgi:hypothetical protein
LDPIPPWRAAEFDVSGKNSLYEGINLEKGLLSRKPFSFWEGQTRFNAIRLIRGHHGVSVNGYPNDDGDGNDLLSGILTAMSGSD